MSREPSNWDLLCDAFFLWLHKSWGWMVGWAGAMTVAKFQELAGALLTVVLIIVGILNAIKAVKDIRKK